MVPPMTAWMLGGAAVGYLVDGWTGAAVGTLVAAFIPLCWPYSFYALVVVISLAILIALHVVFPRLIEVGIVTFLFALPLALGTVMSLVLQTRGWPRLAARAAAGASAGAGFSLLAIIVGAFGFLASAAPATVTITNVAWSMVAGVLIGLFGVACWTAFENVPRVLLGLVRRGARHRGGWGPCPIARKGDPIAEACFQSDAIKLCGPVAVQTGYANYPSLRRCLSISS